MINFRLMLLAAILFLPCISYSSIGLKNGGIEYKVYNVNGKSDELSFMISVANNYNEVIYIYIDEDFSLFRECDQSNSISIWKTFPPRLAYFPGNTTFFEPEIPADVVRLSKNEKKSFPIRINIPIKYRNIIAPSLSRDIKVDLDTLNIKVVIGADIPFKNPKSLQGTVNYNWRHLFSTRYIDFSNVEKYMKMVEISTDFTDADELKKTVKCNFPEI